MRPFSSTSRYRSLTVLVTIVLAPQDADQRLSTAGQRLPIHVVIAKDANEVAFVDDSLHLVSLFVSTAYDATAQRSGLDCARGLLEWKLNF